MLNHPYIPKRKTTWWQWMFLCSRIWFGNILFSISASMFTSKIRLWFFFFAESLYSWGARMDMIGTEDNALHRRPVAQARRLKIHWWELMKQTIFCKVKDTLSRINWRPTEREKIFTHFTSNKRLTSKTYKELKYINNSNKTSNPI